MRQARRGAEGPDQDQHDDEQQQVDARDVDLARGLLGGVADLHARQQAELDRLPGEREGAGDDGLAGDDGRDRRHDDEGQQQALGGEPVERIVDRRRVGEDQCALAEIVEPQRREDHVEPGAADRPAAEMAHIGIERLGARHGQTDRAEDGERHARMVAEEQQRIIRVDRAEDAEVVGDVIDAEPGQRQEPDQHDRPEKGGDAVGAVALHQEQADQDHRRDPQDVVVERRRDQLHALDGREHRDRGGDDGVAVEQAGTDHAEQQGDMAARPAEAALGQRDERQDAAFAVVVGPHQQHDIFQRHHDDQRPQDQREHADDDGWRDGGVLLAAGRGEDRLAQRIERARADVAIDDAERAQRQCGIAGLGVALAAGMAVAVVEPETGILRPDGRRIRVLMPHQGSPRMLRRSERPGPLA